jgi:AsmA protein
MKPRQLTWKWLLLALVAIVIAGLVLLPDEFEPPTVVRDRIAAVLSEWTGATVTLTEPLSVRYYPPLSLRGGLVLTNATKLPSVSAITARDVKISLDPLELLMGRINVDGVRLAEPTITLKENAASAALIAGALADVPVGAVRIRRGTIKTASGESLVSDLDVRLAAGGRGALTTMGSLNFRGESVAFAVDSGALSDTEGKPSAPVTISVTSKPMTARFSGTARCAEGLELDGDVKAEMVDARRFLNWVGVALPEGKSLKGLSASGTAHWSGSTLTFDDGTFSLDGNEADGLLALTAGERPRVEGTLAFERLVLDPYLGESEEVTPQGPPFDWALLKYFDADLRISAGEIAASSLELGGGGLTISAKGGVISTEVGELELCGGEAAGRMGLDLSGKRVRASLVGDLSDITLETCLQPFALGVPLKGVGTLKLDISTGGKTRDELIRGLVGEFQVTAQNGAVPVDLPQLMAGADPKGTGWSQQSVTPFQTLDADCRLSAGHIWCQTFSMETPRGVVSGSGGVDVGKQTLDWDFLIANPVAPLSASQLIMETPPRVIVRGPLTQPLIQRANRPTLGDGSMQANPGTSSASPR